MTRRIVYSFQKFEPTQMDACSRSTVRFEFQAAESMPRAIKRLVAEQANLAISALHIAEPDKSTHQVRVACKRIRAVLALLPPTDDLRRLDQTTSAIAHRLSDSRDATVIQRWLKTLPRSAATKALRHEVAAERDAAHRDLDDRFSDVAERLAWLAREVRLLNVPSGFKVVRQGWAAGYGRAKTARLTKHHDYANKHDTADLVHRWRKRVKRHGYQTELLLPSAPHFYQPRLSQLQRLGDRLGDWHDLSLVADRLAHSKTRAHIRTRQTALVRPMVTAGKRLFRDDVDEITRQVNRHWRAWRKRV